MECGYCGLLANSTSDTVNLEYAHYLLLRLLYKKTHLQYTQKSVESVSVKFIHSNFLR